MDWFGMRRRTKERAELEVALAKIGARLNAVEVLSFHLLRATPPTGREQILGYMREFVASMGNFSPPDYVPERRVQVYRDELSRQVQASLKMVREMGPIEEKN